MSPLILKGDVIMSINMGELIRIKNLTGFPVGFMRINGGGEVNIPPNTSISVDRGEVISQVQTGSILFCGERVTILTLGFSLKMRKQESMLALIRMMQNRK